MTRLKTRETRLVDKVKGGYTAPEDNKVKTRVLSYIKEHDLIPVPVSELVGLLKKDWGVQYSRQYLWALVKAEGLPTQARKRSTRACTVCKQPIRKYHGRPSKVHRRCSKQLTEVTLKCALCQKPVRRNARKSIGTQVVFCSEAHRRIGLRDGLVAVGRRSYQPSIRETLTGGEI